MRGSAMLLIKPVMMRAKEPHGLKELLTPLLPSCLPALRRPTHHHHLRRRRPPTRHSSFPPCVFSEWLTGQSEWRRLIKNHHLHPHRLPFHGSLVVLITCN